MKINTIGGVLFDEGFSKQILIKLGYKIDKEGYITEKGKRILSISNEPILLTEFGGMARIKGKIFYIKRSFHDLLLLYEKEDKNDNRKRSNWNKRTN